MKKELFNSQIQNEMAKHNALMSIIPKEGELFSVRGGLGNKILKEVTMINGTIYERNSPSEKWERSNLIERILKSFNI